MNSKILKVLLITLLFSLSMFGQNKDEGKLRFIFANVNLSEINDSVKLHIFHGADEVLELNVSELKKTKWKNELEEKKVFVDRFLQKGSYILVIDGLFDKPVLINNLTVRKKVMNYIPIDINVLSEYYSKYRAIIIADQDELFDIYYEESMKLKE